MRTRRGEGRKGATGRGGLGEERNRGALSGEDECVTADSGSYRVVFVNSYFLIVQGTCPICRRMCYHRICVCVKSTTMYESTRTVGTTVPKVPTVSILRPKLFRALSLVPKGIYLALCDVFPFNAFARYS